MVLQKVSPFLKRVVPYFLLFYLSIWQANSLFKIDSYEDNLWIISANLAFYFFLAFWNPKILKVFLVLTCLLAIFIYPTLKIYQHFDKDFIASLLFTNAGESKSYLGLLTTKIYINIFLLLLFTGTLLFLKFEKPTSKILKYIFLLFLFIPPFFTYSKIKNKNEDDIRNIWYCQVSPIRYGIFLTKTFQQVIRENDEILKQASLPDSWILVNKSQVDLKENVVIVIGESVRRDVMHYYGFPVQNTPFIDSSTHLSFTNFISVATHTVITLKRMLAFSNDITQPKLNNSIVNLTKKMGYKTYWISNQGYIGLYDSPISVFAKSCDENFNLSGGEYVNHKKDKEMLPIFRRLVKKKNAPKVIFLHTIGSHPSPCTITDGKYDEFYVSDQLSCYSKTIKNTDALLSSIYQTLKSTEKPFTLIYFSDHGVAINQDNTIVHGEGIRQAYDIPLFVWSDDFQQKQTIHALRNGKDFIYFFTELSHLKTKNIQRNYRFISEDIDSTANDVLKVTGWRAKYNELGNNPMPTQNEH